MTETYFTVTEQPISIETVIEQVKRREAGAITTFIGTVREFTNDKRTLQLEYQAYHSMAEKKLADIGEEVQEKWPDAITAITHRIGLLQITDAAVVIAVSSPHRKTAYEANEFVINRIKEVVPIWKKEFWEDGTSWVGDQLETTPYSAGEPWKGEYDD